MKIFLKKTILLISVILIILISNVTHAAFTEPTTAPSSSDQDFPQNILGANNNNNDFDSTNVTANNDGSLIERLEYIITSLSSLWTKVGNLLYYNTGNVGIGTSTPSALLEVSGDGQSALKVTDVTNSITTGIWSGTTQGSIGTLTNTDLRFLTNGTSKMTIDTSGNVGVGTTGPTSALHVSTANNQIQIELDDGPGATSAKDSFITMSHYNNSEEPTFLIGGRTASGDSWVNIGGYDTVSGVANAVESIKFFTAANDVTVDGTERMRIDNTGNVGIGTTAPRTTLDVAGRVNVGTHNEGDAVLTIERHSDDYPYGVIRAGLADNDLGVGLGFDYRTSAGVATTGMFLNSSGNIGIGTTGPNRLLTLAKSDDPALQITRGSNSIVVLGDVGAGGSDGGELLLYDSSANLKTLISGTRDSYIQGGNVGIGTTNPGAKLDVDGAIKATSISTSGTEQLKTYTYTNTVDAAEKSANHVFFTITAVDRTKVRSLTMAYNNVSIGGGTIYGELGAYLASCIGNGQFFMESATSVHVGLGSGTDVGDIISITIVEAM